MLFMLDCKGVNFLHISITNSCTQICLQKTCRISAVLT